MRKSSDYLKLALEHVGRLMFLKKRRDEITKEMRRVDQMVKAAMAMLPDEERALINERIENAGVPIEGLTDAIRKVLFDRFQRGYRGNNLWMTPVQIKDELQKTGYDFSAYKSNPLISVHGILRRLERKEVNYREMPDGSRGYKLNNKVINQRIIHPQMEPKFDVAEYIKNVRKQTAEQAQKQLAGEEHESGITDEDIPF